jgi:hypothetical protein
MNKLMTTKPPKNREFLGLVECNGGCYWDIFFWATRENGINGKSCYTDRMLFKMPDIAGWVDLPNIEI